MDNSVHNHTSQLNLRENLSAANLANRSANNAVSEVLIGSNQNGGIDISGRTSTHPPKPESQGRHSNLGGGTDKSQHLTDHQHSYAPHEDPLVEEVDDGIKSARVSIADGEGVEYDEDEHAEGENDHSK
jgi:hypothetical protein